MQSDHETTRHEREHSARSRTRADSGATFVEILVAIVLTGLVVIATLAALRATIIGTRLERDHSKAQQWLQSAAEVIEDQNYGECDSVPLSGPQIQSNYQLAVDAEATRPFGFAGATMTVGIPDVWDGSQFVAFGSQTTCYDDVLLRQQRVQIEVTSSDGEIIESVQVIKRDRPGANP
ncbi:MAG: hypothetical protein QNJ12_15135 [Ilumatobacter sp.]|uniref:PulJ/GspJ family protein n=1 Tax=Ilumatobacter sp. TaxID=1967498 RepID=UPI00262ACD28|nr:hypothetical protein [Ilumatobacter sp.]MDJ0770134.1 hypothetical protein [Ilumatobacter sp.]